jgi:crossover junction endodeoxyribonuclease RuvC
MRILGIDPGLQRCGYACLNTGATTPELIEAGVFQTDPGLSMEARLNQIAEDTESLLKKLFPEVVAVEELYSHYAHRRRRAVLPLRTSKNRDIDGTRKRCYITKVRTGRHRS